MTIEKPETGKRMQSTGKSGHILFGAVIAFCLFLAAIPVRGEGSAPELTVPDYAALRQSCQTLNGQNNSFVECCLTSVDLMEKGRYPLAVISGGERICPDGYRPDILRCPSSFNWCEPQDADHANRG